MREKEKKIQEYNQKEIKKNLKMKFHNYKEMILYLISEKRVNNQIKIKAIFLQVVLENQFSHLRMSNLLIIEIDLRLLKVEEERITKSMKEKILSQDLMEEKITDKVSIRIEIIKKDMIQEVVILNGKTEESLLNKIGENLHLYKKNNNLYKVLISLIQEEKIDHKHFFVKKEMLRT
jgi:hypothetical protein